MTGAFILSKEFSSFCVYLDKWNTSTLLSSTEKSPKSPTQFTTGNPMLVFYHIASNIDKFDK